MGRVAPVPVQVLLPQLNGDVVASINQGPTATGEHLTALYEPEPAVEFQVPVRRHGGAPDLGYLDLVERLDHLTLEVSP